MDNQSELENVLNQMKDEENIRINTINSGYYGESNTVNADRLNVMAYINLALSIIAAIWVVVNYSKSSITDKFSFVGIVGAIGIIIAGLTLFFLLKTIVDIYWKVEE